MDESAARAPRRRPRPACAIIATISRHVRRFSWSQFVSVTALDELHREERRARRARDLVHVNPRGCWSCARTAPRAPAARAPFGIGIRVQPLERDRPAELDGPRRGTPSPCRRGRSVRARRSARCGCPRPVGVRGRRWPPRAGEHGRTRCGRGREGLVVPTLGGTGASVGRARAERRHRRAARRAVGEVPLHLAAPAAFSSPSTNARPACREDIHEHGIAKRVARQSGGSARRSTRWIRRPSRSTTTSPSANALHGSVVKRHARDPTRPPDPRPPGS